MVARVAAAVAMSILIGGCADANDLRAQQADQFKVRCLSFAIRSGINKTVYDKLNRIPASRFRVGAGKVHGGVDSLEPCRTK